MGGCPFIGGGALGPNSVQASVARVPVKVGAGAVVSSGIVRQALLTSLPLAGGFGSRHWAQLIRGAATVPVTSTVSASKVAIPPSAASGGIPRIARIVGPTISDCGAPRSGLQPEEAVSTRSRVADALTMIFIRTPP